MAVTISNYRITPFSQKDGLAKVIFGGTWGIEITLPTTHESGDGYILAVDYERIVYPLSHPVCAYSNDFALDGNALSMSVGLGTTRLAKWLSSIKKPTPICVQIVRVRGEIYETLLLDEILALPSVANGDAYADPHSPIMDTLAAYVGDGSTTIRQGGVVKGVINANQKTDNIIDLDAGGGGGGSARQATDEEIDARESTTHSITPNNLDYAGRSVVPNITTIPAATTAYALLDATATTNNHSWQYAHAPSTAPTYTLPAVSNTTISHLIILTVDFATVQTLSFVDANGDPLTMQYTPTIAANDVYTFRCEYSAVQGKWLIYPVREGGATTNDFVLKSEVGAANGVASLDSNGYMPTAELPVATSNDIGAVKVNSSYGVSFINASTPTLKLTDTNDIQLSNRSTPSNAIKVGMLNKAVTAALTDANKISLTDAQKASAQDTLGVGPAPVVFTTAGDAPTTSTVGTPGRRAVNTADGKVWTCTAVNMDETDPQNPVTTYTWTDDINAKGGLIKNGTLVVNNSGSGWVRLGYGVIDLSGINNITTGSTYGVIYLGGHCETNYVGLGLFIGTHLRGSNMGSCLFIGTYNQNKPNSNMRLCVGNGTANAHSNSVELYGNGDLYIAGGHQQHITEIPSATTAYTLAEGVQSHAPAEASTYVFPAVTDTTRTHECILTVRFSNTVLTYAFEDSAGNTITPLPLAGTIADGSVVCFRCTWEALLNQWVVMPVMLNPYSA